MHVMRKMKLLELISALYRVKDIDLSEKNSLIKWVQENEEEKINKKLRQLNQFSICRELIDGYLTNLGGMSDGENIR